MAIAVDEYGGTAFITLQDVVEQFVGGDNPDATGPAARSIGPDQWIVDGNAASTVWIDPRRHARLPGRDRRRIGDPAAQPQAEAGMCTTGERADGGASSSTTRSSRCC